jgi:flagellar assembly factor FliW
MPSVETKYFGTLPCDAGSVFDFPQGLPAFEEEKAFVLIEGPLRQGAPLVFLQSMARASLCFVALPVVAIDQSYQLAIVPEDLEDLDLDPGQQPALGAEVTVLALVTFHGEPMATANLMAPVVLNVKTRRGLQAIRRDSRYSHEHPIARQTANTRTTEKTC